MQKNYNVKKTEKEFLKIALFRSVKQINGEKIFKMLYEASKMVDYPQKMIDKQLSSQQYFLFVKQGEVMVYKIKADGKERSLFKSYRINEYCGFQDYPLFWGETLEVQVAVYSQLVIVPLEYFYIFFRRVIPMTYLQSKADYLKKLPLFREIELQKILKLACISHRYRVPKQKILTKEGEQISNIFLICSGKFQLKSSLIRQTIYCRQNEDFLVKEVRQNIPICYFTARCVSEAEILAISKEEFKKIIDIQSKQQQQNMQRTVDYKQQTLHSDDQEHTYKQIKQNNTSFVLNNEEQKFYKTYCGRIQTEKNHYRRQIRSAYKPRQKGHIQTQSSEEIKSPTSMKNFSLGWIHLLKFIRRKEKMENKNFIRYIQSRAPEIVLNPSKQFAMVKPLYISSSQYVRNMKRKIRRCQHLQRSEHYSWQSTALES